MRTRSPSPRAQRVKSFAWVWMQNGFVEVEEVEDVEVVVNFSPCAGSIRDHPEGVRRSFCPVTTESFHHSQRTGSMRRKPSDGHLALRVLPDDGNRPTRTSGFARHRMNRVDKDVGLLRRYGMSSLVQEKMVFEARSARPWTTTSTPPRPWPCCSFGGRQVNRLQETDRAPRSTRGRAASLPRPGLAIGARGRPLRRHSVDDGPADAEVEDWITRRTEARAARTGRTPIGFARGSPPKAWCGRAGRGTCGGGGAPRRHVPPLTPWRRCVSSPLFRDDLDILFGDAHRPSGHSAAW